MDTEYKANNSFDSEHLFKIPTIYTKLDYI